jgi:release factor glutamine methyltransferase
MTSSTEASLQETEREILSKITRAMGNAPKTVYAPSEDSHLMLEAVAKLPVEGKKLLDVGTGSGILGLFCAMRGARVTVTEVDETALRRALRVAETLGLRIETILSDVFSDVEGLFDVILFNPPYLPSLAVEDKTIDGGQGGVMLSSQFLDELSDHLDRRGTALLLVSSLNEPESLISQHPEFQFSAIAKRPLFFEELLVLRIRFRDDLAS